MFVVAHQGRILQAHKVANRCRRFTFQGFHTTRNTLAPTNQSIDTSIYFQASRLSNAGCLSKREVSKAFVVYPRYANANGEARVSLDSSQLKFRHVLRKAAALF
jgi:hypothetical protein